MHRSGSVALNLNRRPNRRPIYACCRDQNETVALFYEVNAKCWCLLAEPLPPLDSLYMLTINGFCTNLVHKSGTQIWYTNLVHKFGTQMVHTWAANTSKDQQQVGTATGEESLQSYKGLSGSWSSSSDLRPKMKRQHSSG